MEPCERSLVERGGSLAQSGHVVPPGLDRIADVETRDDRDLLPQAVLVGLPEEGLGPALRETRDHRPRPGQPRRQVDRYLAATPRLGAGGPRRLDVCEELGIRVADHLNDSRALRIEQSCL